MRSIFALSALAALMLAGPATAQRTANNGPCTTPARPSPERLQALAQRLQALARQYHPEALSPANRHASQLVGLVLDTDCRVLHHTTGKRVAETIDVEATLAVLFPGVRTTPFVVAGIADADVNSPPGGPWIVWAVVKS